MDYLIARVTVNRIIFNETRKENLDYLCKRGLVIEPIVSLVFIPGTVATVQALEWDLVPSVAPGAHTA